MKQENAREEIVPSFLEMSRTDGEKQVQTDQHRLQQYLQFFGISDTGTPKLIEQEIASRLPQDISYKTDQFASQLLIKIARHSRNYEFIDLEVRLGYFTFNRVSIIHINAASPVHDICNCDTGGFCSVYHCECEGSNFAFKCFSKERIKCLDNSTSILEKVIGQYCLLRLASCFSAGPKMADSFGFSIGFVIITPSESFMNYRPCALSRSTIKGSIIRNYKGQQELNVIVGGGQSD